MRRFSGLLALVSVALAAASLAPAGTAAPSIAAVPTASVLTLAGRGFAPGERVTVAVTAGQLTSAARSRLSRVAATAHGTFRIRVAGYAPCAAWIATARGAVSGRERFHSDVPECRRLVAKTTAAPVPTTGTGVAGSVRRGPTRPVCVAELPCDGPASGVTVELAGAGGVVGRTTTGADGRFAFTVGPGKYTVSVVGFTVAPTPVEVKAGVVSQVAISLDTGIR